MANAVLDGSGERSFTTADGENYGCAGRGIFDPFAKTVGRQVDPADKAFYIWKKCIQCAIGNEKNLQNLSYVYDKGNDSCGEF